MGSTNGGARTEGNLVVRVRGAEGFRDKKREERTYRNKVAIRKNSLVNFFNAFIICIHLFQTARQNKADSSDKTAP